MGILWLIFLVGAVALAIMFPFLWIVYVMGIIILIAYAKSI